MDSGHETATILEFSLLSGHFVMAGMERTSFFKYIYISFKDLRISLDFAAHFNL